MDNWQTQYSWSVQSTSKNPGTEVAVAALLFWSTVGAALAGTPVPFTEEAVARGINYTPRYGNLWGRGLALADLDDDGDPDLITLGALGDVPGIYENDGSGNFIDRSIGSGIGPTLRASGVIAGDYDNDGDLDLYISCWMEPNFLYRNEGGFVFTDQTGVARVGDPGGGQGCAWGDYDNDGLLDLYVANRPEDPISPPPIPNRLYHNLGNGEFEEVALLLGVDRGNDPTFQASFVDFDRDGDADLYLATDKGECDANGWRNHLFENVGGTFVDITASSGTEACIEAMCIAIGDFNGNGHQDFYCTNGPPGNALFINQGDSTFTAEAGISGTSSFALGWGSVMFDFDNDRDLDLYVCNQTVENRLYRNDSAWPCVGIASSMGVDDSGASFTTAVADVDNDGDMDLFLANIEVPIRLFINNNGGIGNWVKFDVIGEGPARYAIGANIRVRTASTWQLREVIAGCNFKNQNDLVQHIGLGSASITNEIEITWPGGYARTLTNYPANQTWTLYPSDKLGDGDQDSDQDQADTQVFASCLTPPKKFSILPGCEMMDFDGDSDVDLGDFAGYQDGFSP